MTQTSKQLPSKFLLCLAALPTYMHKLQIDEEKITTLKNCQQYQKGSSTLYVIIYYKQDIWQHYWTERLLDIHRIYLIPVVNSYHTNFERDTHFFYTIVKMYCLMTSTCQPYLNIINIIHNCTQMDNYVTNRTQTY